MSTTRKVQVGMRLSEELIARVDAVRGDVPRTKWIERCIGYGLRAWEAGSRSSDPFASFTVTGGVPAKTERLEAASRVPGVQFAPRATSSEAKANWRKS